MIDGIPVVSDWGLLMMTLPVLTIGTVVHCRRFAITGNLQDPRKTDWNA